MMYVLENKRTKAITGGVNAHGDSAEHARKRSERAQFHQPPWATEPRCLSMRYFTRWSAPHANASRFCSARGSLRTDHGRVRNKANLGDGNNGAVYWSKVRMRNSLYCRFCLTLLAAVFVPCALAQ